MKLDRLASLAQLSLTALALSVGARDARAAASAPAPPQGTPIGFEETFALAADREAALAELLPGTEDYYFYHCLQRQHEGRFDEVEALLAQWVSRHGRTGRVQEMENRQALLTYEQDPAATLDHLRRELGLHFNHQRQIPGEIPDLPTQLDPALLEWSRLAQDALRYQPHTVSGFHPAAYDRLVGLRLDERQLADLLNKLQRPDHASLPALVVRELATKRSRGFGSLAVHGLLTLEQLEACVALRPALLNDSAFVTTYLPRLAPGADEDGARDAAVRGAHLERLWAFVDRLDPAHNSLKAHVLYHRLAFDLQQGRPDRARFTRYLQLPRSTGSYVNPDYLKGRRDPVANLSADYPTELGVVQNDEGLVRQYLAHFLADEDSVESFATYVRRDVLERILAEEKILAGVGDMERWYSLIDDPAYYEELEQRVEIEFPPTVRREFGADESVAIEVDVKNVPTLLVKVFEVNALAYYLDQEREVDSAMALDGLVAGEETTYELDASPYRRVRRSFEFPALARPGVFIVEFIGAGTSSRVVIQKGRLSATERIGAAGHVFHVVDESGDLVPDGSVRLGGRLYEADEDGAINVPFASEGGARKIVLQGAGRASLSEFEQLQETYQLEAGFHVERETLLSGNTARLVVRPTLWINGRPASLELLEDVRLEIISTDRKGVQSGLVTRDPELDSSAEFVQEFQIPEHLVTLQFALVGHVKQLTSGTQVELVSRGQDNLPSTRAVNGIDGTNQIAAPLLGRTPAGYVIDLLGRNGEPVADRAIHLQLEHRLVTHSITLSLKTDAAGRVELGPLADVRSLNASVEGANASTWQLQDPAHTQATRLQGIVGLDLRVPYEGMANQLGRDIAALFELRSGQIAADRFELLALEDRYVVLRGLPAGDYRLHLKESERTIPVRVTSGGGVAGWGIGKNRMLQLSDPAPMQVTAFGVEGDALVVRLENAGRGARVHLWSDRYMPAFDPFADLSVGYLRAPGASDVPRSASVYRSGREIGDEYRYILDRRYAKKFPGNMLTRPELLLNPWALEETSAAIGLGGGAGGGYGGRFGGRKNLKAGGGVGRGRAHGASPHAFANLDFLPAPAGELLNLRPDAQGVVRVPLAELSAGHYVVALAVDGEDLATEDFVLPEQTLEPLDLRLVRAIDPALHVAQQGVIEVVGAGETVDVGDVRTAEQEVYGSLSDVYRLYRALGPQLSPEVLEPLTRWPDLGDEEQRAYYSENACHEFNVFLHEKDPEFFEGIVRPYLANKADKTFIDHWLLDHDLGRYLEPWDFQQLNLVERILLANRVEGRAAAAARKVREQFELLPRNPADEAWRFETALGGSALASAGDILGGVEFEAGGAESLGRRARAPQRDFRGPSDTAPPASEQEAMEERALMDSEADDAMPEAAQSNLEALGYAGADEAKEKDLARRELQRALWRNAGRTRAYVEHNWWHRTIGETGPGMIPVNAFWRDFAASPAGAPFLSTNFTACSSSITEMWLALAFLDLPFEAAEHELAVDGERLNLTAGGPLLLVRRDLSPTQPGDVEPLLIGENFFRQGDRFVYVDGERRDKFVADEFLVNTAYGCQVVLSNPTSRARDLEFLYQIPEGALPLGGALETRGQGIRLEGYQTRALEYAFYFPAVGDFAHYPAHVSDAGNSVASAEPSRLNVVTDPSQVDTTSWEYVSQRGTESDVLAFLNAENVERLDLGRIAWRLRDRQFFTTVVDLLRNRFRFDSTVWSYGIHHADPTVAAEYVRTADGFLRRCGLALASPLVTIEPVERKTYQHLEFKPLINARAHRFGERLVILDANLARQYKGLLSVLAYRPLPTDADWLEVTYYMLLQDRVAEAFDAFARVDQGALDTRLQIDAVRAYLAFYTDEPQAARPIAEAYRDHPVPRWRNRFLEVLAQLDELEGSEATSVDPEDRMQQQTELAATSPSLELEIETGRLRIDSRNLESCEVRFYEMDIEFLFSMSPFAQASSGAFAFVQPNQRLDVALDSAGGPTLVNLPAELAGANLMIEVDGGGVVRRGAHYANQLVVQAIESYGQLRVTHAETGAPLSKVYVKLYGRDAAGRTWFHKDGYTDHRGRFDYASLTKTSGGALERFAALILSETDGAVIRELAPPLE